FASLPPDVVHMRLPSRLSALPYLMECRTSAPSFPTRLAAPPTHPLRSMTPSSASDLCIPAAAGTELAVSSSSGTINATAVNGHALFPNDRSLQSEDLHPPRGVAPSGFPPLRKILDCCHP